jgi:hypothetical protein
LDQLVGWLVDQALAFEHSERQVDHYLFVSWRRLG